MAIKLGLSRTAILISAGVIASSGITGLALGGAFASEDSNPPAQVVVPEDDSPATNLVAVVATNGNKGFVDRELVDELTGANMKSLAEAVAWQKQMDATTWDVKEIPVYEADGKTQIGVFPISRSQGTGYSK